MTATAAGDALAGLNPLHRSVAQRFPLTQQARPACRDLEERVRSLGALTDSTESLEDPEERVTRAAQCLNVAALIASDCGVPDLARRLCWQQFDCFPTDRPFPADTAKLLLQPLINLGRLMIRDGNGDGAFQLLKSICTAFTSGASAVLDGRSIDLQTLTISQDHPVIEHYLNDVFLVDGVRALTKAGRWDDALVHARERGGTGLPLSEGFQVDVVIRCRQGDFSGALGALAGSESAGPAPRAVAVCLLAFCLSAANQLTPLDQEGLYESFADLDPAPQYVVFRTQLALAMADLAAGSTVADQILDAAIAGSLDAADAYAAAALLSHTACQSRMTHPDQRVLSGIVASAVLRRGAIPAPLLAQLERSTAESQATLTRELA